MLLSVNLATKAQYLFVKPYIFFQNTQATLRLSLLGLIPKGGFLQLRVKKICFFHPLFSYQLKKEKTSRDFSLFLHFNGFRVKLKLFFHPFRKKQAFWVNVQRPALRNHSYFTLSSIFRYSSMTSMHFSMEIFEVLRQRS